MTRQEDHESLERANSHFLTIHFVEKKLYEGGTMYKISLNASQIRKSEDPLLVELAAGRHRTGNIPLKYRGRRTKWEANTFRKVVLSVLEPQEEMERQERKRLKKQKAVQALESVA